MAFRRFMLLELLRRDHVLFDEQLAELYGHG